MPDLSKATARPFFGRCATQFSSGHGSWRTIKDRGVVAGESDHGNRHYAEAHKINRDIIYKVREETGKGMQCTALIVQIEHAMVMIGVRV
jgi:hypothetical protein